MDKLFHHKYSLRQHLFTLIGIALCIYFGYHIIHGERSITKLMYLSQQIETQSQIGNNLHADRAALEEKVVMMRPGSINKDLLEEQVRLVLGYKHSNELIILDN